MLTQHYTLDVVLPSKGIIYDEISEKFKIRNITTKEEKLIYAQNNDNFMWELVEECIVEPQNIDTNELILADTYFLLIKLRAHTYGSTYNIEYTCPECGFKNKYAIDFEDEFPVYELEDDFTEPVFFTLPVSEDEIGIKLLRGKDLQDATKEADRKIRSFPGMRGDPTLEVRMKKYISHINGEKADKIEVDQYVEQGLHGKDSAYFWHKVKDIKIGYEARVYRTCNNSRCGADLEFIMPLTPEFFRPSFDD